MKPVLVTTNNRGIYYGYLADGFGSDWIVLDRARVCVSWDTGSRGFLHLAVEGPVGVADVSPAVGRLTVYGVATVAECSPRAAKAWDEA